ncbi:hypothetical protein [Odoribacter lunatus]|uniref:hypothetical protein n=1 Tax=Odoribacter lunatus TaxID=2941335 RepID=UPI00203BC8BA|nr:hypothetical protein [Odoribacter lunatus]
MLFRMVLSLCFVFCCFPLFSQEVPHELEEVVVSDRSLSQIIKKVSSRLTRKLKTQSFPYPNFYGNARYEKIVESKGRAIQFDRDYGLYLTTGNYKHSSWDFKYGFRFLPVYSAYSFRLTSNGKDTLRFHYFVGGPNYNKNFDSNSSKIFPAMRALTLYGPLFSSPDYYSYRLMDNSNNTYTIAFSPKMKYYLKKIRALCSGTMQIDKSTLHLKSMQLDDFVYHHYQLARKFNNSAQSPYRTRMNVQFAYEGDVCHITSCYTETRWMYPKNDLYKSIEVASRPYPDQQEIVEKEAWQVENVSSFPHDELDEVFHNSTSIVYGKYVPEVFRSVPLLPDAPKAIEELSQYMDVEQQYRLFNYAGIWNEHTYLNAQNYRARVPFSQLLIQKLFKEPVSVD